MDAETPIEQPRFIEPGTPEELEAREGPLPFYITLCEVRYAHKQSDRGLVLKSSTHPVSINEQGEQ